MAELDLTDIRTDHHVAWAKRAVLLTDIVGSVGLIEQDEVGVISHWLDFVDRVRRDILPPHNGRLVKRLGDGMLLDFADVRSAVSAALAFSPKTFQALARRSQPARSWGVSFILAARPSTMPRIACWRCSGVIAAMASCCSRDGSGIAEGGIAGTSMLAALATRSISARSMGRKGASGGLLAKSARQRARAARLSPLCASCRPR